MRPEAPAQDASVAERCSDALAQAKLPTGHILSFNNTLYFVFAGLDPDQRGKKTPRLTGSMVVSDTMAPAVARFAELDGSSCVAGHETRAATSVGHVG